MVMTSLTHKNGGLHDFIFKTFKPNNFLIFQPIFILFSPNCLTVRALNFLIWLFTLRFPLKTAEIIQEIFRLLNPSKKDGA